MKSIRTKNSVLSWSIINASIFITLLPFIWAIITSLRSDLDLLRGNSFWPSEFTTQNFTDLFQTYFFTWLFNSFKVGFSVSIIALCLAIPVAFFITHRLANSSKIILPLLVFGFIAPSGLLFLPISRNPLVVNLPQLIGLALVYLSFITPQAIWLLCGYFRDVNSSFERISKIEGSTTLNYIIKILIPSTWNGIIFTLFYCIIISWGEYTYALVLTNDKLNWTLPIGLSSLETGDIIPWGRIMAGIVLSTIPLLFLLFIVWNRFNRRGQITKFGG
jgi:multiple sugar transport system permease protein